MPKMGLTLVRASYGDLGHSRIEIMQLQYMFISSLVVLYCVVSTLFLQFQHAT